MRKFTLFLVVAFSLTAFLAGYVMVQRGTESGSKTGTILDKFSEQRAEEEEQQRTTKVALKRISERRVSSLTNSLNKDSVLYYEDGTGKLFELNIKTGDEEVVSDKMLPNFLSATWSPLKKEVIGGFTSDSGLVFKYLNIDTAKEVNLDPGIYSVAFSPDGNYIAYFLPEATAKTAGDIYDVADNKQSGKIIISQPDGAYKKTLLNTRLENVKIQWPVSNKLVLKLSTNELYILSDDGKLSRLTGSEVGLEEKWSPSGNKLLLSLQDQETGTPMLWVRDIGSEAEYPLSIEGRAYSCVWSRDDIIIYCTVAKSASTSELYLINTADKSSQLLAEPEIIAKDLLLSTLQDYIIFTSAIDKKLYSIKISD